MKAEIARQKYLNREELAKVVLALRDQDSQGQQKHLKRDELAKDEFELRD